MATTHYAPDRDYDLLNVSVDLDIDYPSRTFQGRAVDTLTPLRNGLSVLKLHAQKKITIRSVTVNGVKAAFERNGRDLLIQTKPLKRGQKVAVAVSYDSARQRGGSFGMGGGWHWIEPQKGDPYHVGFWTQGEAEYNSAWLPTWDYPNDFATSQTRVTVPADWTVISNGVLASKSKSKDGKKLTYFWRMDVPHATYLISIAGGPMDVKTDVWRGVTLRYAVPKGKGNLIDDSFGDTPDMLSYFSDVLGVKYPWPQYAQTAAYDFGGGMENVSATTLGQDALTSRRDGFRNMASLTSHELAHQWFGDLVTCKDWGHVWLNEGFATYFEGLYMGHSRGKNQFQRELDQFTRSYLAEARQRPHALMNRVYHDGDDTFDSHAYSKGAMVLHTMRCKIGDDAFFRGLHNYLVAHRNKPVDSSDLCRALTDASGIDLEPFFEQWVYKPGHPVLTWSWKWDESKREAVVTCKQVQNTANGTPIYVLDINLGIISSGKVRKAPIHLSKAEDTFAVACVRRPDAVLLDPDHEMLREILDQKWGADELPFIVRFAPDAVDRNQAANQLLTGEPSDAAVNAVVQALQGDRGRFPVFQNEMGLARTVRPGLRSFWRGELSHPCPERQLAAVTAFTALPADPSDAAKIRALVDDNHNSATVATAIRVLARWDASGNVDVFRKAAKLQSPQDLVRFSALVALAQTGDATAIDGLVEAASPKKPQRTRLSALTYLGQLSAAEPKSRAALEAALGEDDWRIVDAGAAAAVARRDVKLVPALKRALDKDLPSWTTSSLEEAISKLSGKSAS